MSQPQAPYHSYGPPPPLPVEPPQPFVQPKKGAGLAIVSMVLGIVALLLSWVPVINNLAAVLAVVGLALGIPALLRARRGTHSGSGMAITGLVTSVLAIVAVVVTQVLYSSVIHEVQREIERGTAAPDAATSDAAEEPIPDAAATSDVVPLGVPAQIGDYQVTVDAVALPAHPPVAGADVLN